MNINIALGTHNNLVDVIAKVINHPEKKDILMLELIPHNFKNLGLPPSLETCTRDIYTSGFSLELSKVLNILKFMASACCHIHEHKIMHGDFYAHNIMIEENGNCILGDFGAASYYEAKNMKINTELEQIEVRAYGCLIEELIALSIYKDKDEDIINSLMLLQNKCFDKVVRERPLFKDIIKELDKL